MGNSINNYLGYTQNDDDSDADDAPLNQDYTDMVNEDHKFYEPEDAEFHQAALERYVDSNQLLLTRGELFNPNIRFDTVDGYVTMYTKSALVNDELIYVAETFDPDTLEVFMTKHISQDRTVEYMDSVYDTRYFRTKTESIGDMIMFQGEIYLNGDVFIKDIRSNGCPVTTHQIYNRDGTIFTTCTPGQLRETVERYVREYM